MEGKVVIVTGGASGIGYATALLFAKKGCSVVVADWNQEGGSKIVKQIVDLGGKAIFVETDVSQVEQVRGMVQQTIKHYGKLDYGFNNAGVEGGLFPMGNYSEETWDKTINIDLKGIWLCMKYEISEMIKNKGGAIVNTASVFGLVAAPCHYAYIAAKHGVVGISKAAALEFAEEGIRVNAICPGMIDTPMMDRFLDEESQRQVLEDFPIKRKGSPQEIAECVVWLCSDKASYVTGHAMVIDGGFIAK
jgi:NAD(P)-dependent dehydrogenase (short-subunit alcohol dehydrogenase family)